MSTRVINIRHFSQFGLPRRGQLRRRSYEFYEKKAKEESISHIIFDLQKNYGSPTGTALMLFREFFPGVDPFAGSQRRSHELGNVLGSAAITQSWQNLRVDSESRAPAVYDAGRRRDSA